MRAHIPLSLILVITAVTAVYAQSLPDEAGPSLSHKSSTSQQERITNPSGFGNSTNTKAIDPDRIDSTADPDCRKQIDLRTARSATTTPDIDCVR
jgi:hypothetical protein